MNAAQDRTALVTGSPERAATAADALRRQGCTVTTVRDGEGLAQVCAGLGPESLDVYVQLPVAVTPRGDNLVRLVHDFLAQGLLARFEAAGCVLPALRPDALVVLVAGNHPPGVQTPDDQRARLALLKVLAHAILAEKADSGVRATIVGHDRAADELARLVGDRSAARLQVISQYAEHAPELDYADWRLEILAMSRGEA